MISRKTLARPNYNPEHKIYKDTSSGQMILVDGISGALFYAVCLLLLIKLLIKRCVFIHSAESFLWNSWRILDQIFFKLFNCRIQREISKKNERYLPFLRSLGKNIENLQSWTRKLCGDLSISKYPNFWQIVNYTWNRVERPVNARVNGFQDT